MQKYDLINAQKAFDQFLSEFRESHGDYATVLEEDEKQLHKLLYALRKAKFETDCDGDYPIEFEIINRHKYERMNFRPQPYTHKAKTTEDFIRCIEAAKTNVIMATSQLDIALDALKRQLLVGSTNS